MTRSRERKKSNELIESKQQIEQELLQGSAELNLKELKDGELLRRVASGLNAAIKE